jgi:hypothetical protein
MLGALGPIQFRFAIARCFPGWNGCIAGTAREDQAPRTQARMK